MEKVALVLLSARLNDEAEEELKSGARRGLGDRLLESSSRIEKKHIYPQKKKDKNFLNSTN